VGDRKQYVNRGYLMSIRVFTDEQFSDGTTMDGNRLARAMQELEDRLDVVPDGDLKNRWTQSQIVAGWAPGVTSVGGGTAYLTGAHPWLRTYNNLLDEVGTHTESLSKNAYRLKGTKVPHIDVTTTASYPNQAQYAFTQSILFSRPAIIHSFDVFMMMDTLVSGAAYKFGGTATTPGIDIQILVDNPWAPEDRTQNDIELHYYDFDDSDLLFNVLPAAPTQDMTPAFPGGNNAGVAINKTNLAIPVHQGARVRFSVTIPRYDTSTSTESAKWTTMPWRAFAPSFTLTILEPLTNA
jgi:hypothetical protein